MTSSSINAKRLLIGLIEYRKSLETHLNKLGSDYVQLENRWQIFNTYSEGNYAEQFRAGWTQTNAHFKAYINQAQKIKIFLDERINALTEVNKKDKNIYMSSDDINSSFWGTVEKGITVVQVVGGLLGGIVSAPVPDISRFGFQSGEDLVNEAGVRSSLANEEEIKRRQEEIDTAARVANEPTISAPPDPLPIANAFSDSLQYVDSYNYLDREDGYRSIRIQAKNTDGQEIAFITAEKTSDNRIKIKDTVVSHSFQGKGVGSGLLSSLEKQFPKGTELYFEENLAPDFWIKKGFQKRLSKDGLIEFFKFI
jgi:predicted GNAT family acetyltransferase